MYQCTYSYLLYIFIQFYKLQENISSTVTIMPNQGDTTHHACAPWHSHFLWHQTLCPALETQKPLKDSSPPQLWLTQGRGGMCHPSHRLKQGGAVQGFGWKEVADVLEQAVRTVPQGRRAGASALNEGTGMGMRVSDQIWGAGSFERSRRQPSIEGSWAAVTTLGDQPC